jgi:hypothetical protein
LGYTFDRQHIRWLGNGGAKMSKEEAKPTTYKSNETTADELNQAGALTIDELKDVSGGTPCLPTGVAFWLCPRPDGYPPEGLVHEDVHAQS